MDTCAAQPATDARGSCEAQDEQLQHQSQDISHLQEAPCNESDKPMSKRQAKRLAKQEKMLELKDQRRAQEKEAKKLRKEKRREEMSQAMAAMTEEEREKLIKQHQETRKERSSDTQQRKLKVERSLQEGPDLVIDLDFEGMMTDSELRHLCQQLSYSYSANRKVAQPCHLHLVGYKGDVKEMCERQIQGIPNWHVTKTADSYLEHFKERRDKLVYLSADSQNELDTLDPSSIYIIGGLVDHNRYKDLCLKRAEELGVATARLPIKKYVPLDSRAVLTVNQVVQIMVEMLNRHDWQSVLDEVLPPRKRADFKAAKEKAQKELAEAAAAEVATGSRSADLGVDQAQAQEELATAGDVEVGVGPGSADVHSDQSGHAAADEDVKGHDYARAIGDDATRKRKACTSPAST